jgi:hypothetical protein
MRHGWRGAIIAAGGERYALLRMTQTQATCHDQLVITGNFLRIEDEKRKRVSREEEEEESLIEDFSQGVITTSPISICQARFSHDSSETIMRYGV